MNHHFSHVHKQQPSHEIVVTKKRPNTAIVMKQFYKPGNRPKSSLQQHKILEWKCECGEQLYVNKVMNLNIQNNQLTRGFPGRKIGIQQTNLVKQMKGNDQASRMKFKEMSLGQKINPYDILMEKYTQLKLQEEEQIKIINHTNPYEQLQYFNFPVNYPNQNTQNDNYQNQHNNFMPHQEYNNHNNLQTNEHNLNHNHIPQQQSSFYPNKINKLNSLTIHNLVSNDDDNNRLQNDEHMNSNSYQTNELEQNMQQSDKHQQYHHDDQDDQLSQQDDLYQHQQEQSFQQKQQQQQQHHHQFQQNTEQYQQDQDQQSEQQSQLSQQQQSYTLSQQQQQQQQFYQSQQSQKSYLGSYKQNLHSELQSQRSEQQSQHSQQYNQLEQNYNNIEGDDNEEEGIQYISQNDLSKDEQNRKDDESNQQQQQQQIEDENITENIEQQITYEQLLEQNKQGRIVDNSLEDYPESNKIGEIEDREQFLTADNKVLNTYLQQSQQQQLKQLSKQKSYSSANIAFKKTNIYQTQPHKQLYSQKITSQQIGEDTHNDHHFIDNISILSARKPKRPQTSNLARPLNLNLDMNQVLPLKRVGSATTTIKYQNQNIINSGQNQNKQNIKHNNSIPSSTKNQNTNIQYQEQSIQSIFQFKNAFQRPSSAIKNSSFFSSQQKKRLIIGKITNSDHTAKDGAEISGSVKNLFQQPLINHLGKQVNIRSCKQAYNSKHAGLSSHLNMNTKGEYNQSNINTQTDEYVTKGSQLFITNPLHNHFKVKDLISSSIQSPINNNFNQTTKHYTMQRPYSSLPYTKF